MTNRPFYLWSSVALLTLLLHSCILDTKYPNEKFDGKVLPRITGYQTGVTHDWLYFDLKGGKIYNLDRPNQDIREGEQKERTDWDLAFCGYHMRTNGGTSGIGNGAAADLGPVPYDQVKSKGDLPKDLRWVTDDDQTVRIGYSSRDWLSKIAKEGKSDVDYPWFDPNAGIRTTVTSANALLDKCITLSGPPITYTPTMHVFIIRSADGLRYYKFQIVNWYHPEAEIGSEGGRISYYLDPLP